ncbi:MAG: glycerol-3-phosphate 1-O-acyltransferase PlsY [Coriobacteriia bacterium]|nr:glycerol-3-phosphate 1-O-acyltransferase PlsY [Coriobacteriia bacterium]
MTVELILRFGAVALVAFLFGSIPVSFLMGKFIYGIDPREHGSGSAGATNSARAMGGRAGLAVGVLDIAKGWCAVGAARWLLVPQATFDRDLMWWAVGIATLAVMLGHAYSPWIGFRGGKGVGVAGGACLAIWPPLFFLELGIWFVIGLTTRYISIASITIACLLPIWAFVFTPIRSTGLIVCCVGAALLVVWLHRTNIQRLMQGQENKLSFGGRS